MLFMMIIKPTATLVQQDIIIDNYDTVPDKNTVLKNCKTEI
jgi:hypothetical protein